MKVVIIFTVLFIAETLGTAWSSGGGCASWGPWSTCGDNCQQCKWCHDSSFKGPGGASYSQDGSAWNRRGQFPTRAKVINDYADAYDYGHAHDYAHVHDYVKNKPLVDKRTYMHAELHLPGKTPTNRILPGGLPNRVGANRGGWQPKPAVQVDKRYGVCRTCPAVKCAPSWSAPTPPPPASWRQK